MGKGKLKIAEWEYAAEGACVFDLIETKGGGWLQVQVSW